MPICQWSFTFIHSTFLFDGDGGAGSSDRAELPPTVIATLNVAPKPAIVAKKLVRLLHAVLQKGYIATEAIAHKMPRANHIQVNRWFLDDREPWVSWMIMTRLVIMVKMLLEMLYQKSASWTVPLELLRV